MADNAFMALDQVLKGIQIISYIAGAAAAVSAVFVYRNNSRRERARWVESLYSRFFEKSELKQLRDALDCNANDEKVNVLVAEEGSAWTDYLNFFELVAYLQESRQVAAEDVKALFEYYIGCLKRHRAAIDYIRDETNGLSTCDDYCIKFRGIVCEHETISLFVWNVIAESSAGRDSSCRAPPPPCWSWKGARATL